MIEFFGRVAVLDAAGADPAQVRATLVDRGVTNPSEVLVDLLARGSGGTLPFLLPEGPAARRAFSEIANPGEIADFRSGLSDEAVPIAFGGAGDLLLFSPSSGEVFAELADRSGTGLRTLHVVAASTSELLDLLEPDDGLLDDMVEFAVEDGFPDRGREIEELRRAWSSNTDR